MEAGTFPSVDQDRRKVLKDRIEARLTALGISQFVAAERAGKHPHFIYDFMIDRKQSFKGDGLHRVAHVLNCSVEYLLGQSDEVGKPTPPVTYPTGA